MFEGGTQDEPTKIQSQEGTNLRVLIVLFCELQGV